MTQKHVELLLKAIAVPESCSEFLCDRIGFISGKYKDYPELIEDEYHYCTTEYCQDLCTMIRRNIDHEFSFDLTQMARDGMSREEWVETILVPLALALPEEAQ